MMNAKSHRRVLKIFVFVVLAILMFCSFAVASGEEQKELSLIFPGIYGDSNALKEILSDLRMDSSSVKFSNAKEYSTLYENLESNGKDWCADLAFPLVVDENREVKDDKNIILYTDYRTDITIVAVYTEDAGMFDSIAVVGETVVDQYARMNFASEQNEHKSIIISKDSVDECLAAVKSGEVNCALITEEQATVYLFNNSEYGNLSCYIMPRKCTVALAVKDEKLKEEINTIVAGFNPEADVVGAHIQKYLNTTRKESNIPIVLIVSLCVIGALLVLGYVLTKQERIRKKEQLAVINGLSSDFECVTLLDMKSKHETRYRVSDVFSRSVDGWTTTEDYSLRMRMFAEKLVVEEDRKRFITETEKERVLQRLKENDIYVVNYKINVDGNVLYFQTKYVSDKSSRNCVIAGFHSVDAETRKELELQKKIQENAMVQRLSLQMVTTLVKIIDAKDRYTNGHSIRVATYAREIARRSGMSAERQQEIYYMGLLHDIGKIGIPDEVINKNGKLTDEEFAIVKEHPSLGAGILESITEMPKLRIGALQHHEHYDGTGYPDRLAGKKISPEARILGVADAYDAMSSPRSFRDAYSQEKIRDEFQKGIGTQFDPEYAGHMLDMIDEDKNFEMREQYGLQ